jgi:putative membrane protein
MIFLWFYHSSNKEMMMLKEILIGAVILLSSPVLAQDKAASASATAPMNISDPAEFANMAAVSNMFEIQSSMLASDQSENDDVMAFAQQMISDHEKAAQDMMAAAKAQDVTPPSTLDQKHSAMLEELQGLKGSDFDSAYISAQADAHDEAVSLFGGYIANGPSGALKDFATQTLPTLEMHQKKVHGLAGK